MIRSRGIEDKMRRQRADAKTFDNLFRRRIEAGANGNPFGIRQGNRGAVVAE